MPNITCQISNETKKIRLEIRNWKLKFGDFSSGFTLVEMVVAFALLITASGISIIGFRQFSDRQRTQNAALDVAIELQKARSRAQTQLKPASVTACQSNSLDGYEVQICNVPLSKCTGVGRYELHISCGGMDTLVEAKQLPPNITFDTTSQSSFFFRVLNGGVNIGSVSLTGYGVTKKIQVTGFGNVSVQ